MSIHFADSNVGKAGTGAYYLLPAGAGAKGANVACVFGMFFRTEPLGWELNQTPTMAARGNGGTGGNDIYFRFGQACTSLDWAIRNGGSLLASGSCTGLTAGTKYLLLAIVNPTNVHVVAAPVGGGSPVVSTSNVSTVYAANMGTMEFVERIGGGPSAYGWTGPLEHAFFLTGAFPEASNIPDNTLIVNLATGAQDIDTLDAQLTGGAKGFWYPMRHRNNLSDFWGLAADLSPLNEDAAVGLSHVNGVALRPESIRPADTSHFVSQVEFATAGDSSTATATIPTQGGTYLGISPAAIQARLRKEDNAVAVDWTTVDPAPAGGAWVAGSIPGVAGQAGLLFLDFRAVDGGGSAISPVVSGGTRGAGFHGVIAGQSQVMYMFLDGAGLAIPSGSRLLVARQTGSSANRTVAVGSTSAINRMCRRGARQALIEINTLYPGWPVQFSTVGEVGTPITDFITGGTHVGRWAGLRTAHGVQGPLRLMPMGHSTGPDADYETQFTEMVGIADAQFGSPRVVCMPVLRYKQSGATLTGNALAVHHSRRGMRAWYEANKARALWAWTFAPIASTTEGTSAAEPHPGDNDAGQGREGAIMAWSLMRDCKAVANRPIGIVSARRSGGSVFLKLGAV